MVLSSLCKNHSIQFCQEPIIQSIQKKYLAYSYNGVYSTDQFIFNIILDFCSCENRGKFHMYYSTIMAKRKSKRFENIRDMIFLSSVFCYKLICEKFAGKRI